MVTLLNSMNVFTMEEQILVFKAEVASKTRALLKAEKQQKKSEQEALHSSEQLKEIKEELLVVKAELFERTCQVKCAEEEKKQALSSAKKLTMTFMEYRRAITEKLQKLMESECKLKENLIACHKEKRNLQKTCLQLEKEKEDMFQDMNQMKELCGGAEIINVKSKQLQERLQKAEGEVHRLQEELFHQQKHIQQFSSLHHQQGKMKNSHTALLDKQMGDRRALRRISQLEKELLERSNSLQHCHAVLHKRQQEFQRDLEKVKKAHTEKCKEIENEMVWHWSSMQEVKQKREISEAGVAIQQTAHLTDLISESHRELEQRNNELYTMAAALKECERELQQRAQLIHQLALALKEHKQDLEEKALGLQNALEQTERKLNEKEKQVALLMEKLVQAQIHEKFHREETQDQSVQPSGSPNQTVANQMEGV
ncbi:coiled-coil domain-containing protein 18-like isoform X2 [Denticeps clupeoides]|uniref:coiled-coil domain-containing protein 18 isoform X2 n=1 Tax=Denticeps clupeoides TaxID=299321 RepID=UPI0010A3D457|nr:coiled-coil domain-containing protein 18 isoform X2 [Denticeps clupeoides]XP_028821058.1 coiled-coil domain-containing protein 18-like isoform X2 [Denticeps clupeoides]